MIKDHFLPIAAKLRENAGVVENMEKRLAQEKRSSMEGSEDYEQFVQQVKTWVWYFTLIVDCQGNTQENS